MVELDARRLLCPMPVIRLQDCIEKQSSATRVRITCTDPGTLNDIPTWCRINGHQVLETTQQDHQYIFLVQKDGD
ncbi:MAG: sulfurtransferase TusA family protein [Gammaproteobacteria bacterium]|nr:sulfurtransferase TusA family protein [Gammaproteobacteria bacterium]MCP4878545.1 sulfurtransferase TusA family protein [Gammaproteobacteria bacterium]MCP4981756.1 sulfurtransferase TusA family protein [Gammaproteobacteria bacterium]